MATGPARHRFGGAFPHRAAAAAATTVRRAVAPSDAGALRRPWIVDTDDVILLREPGRYPVAHFPSADIQRGTLITEDRVTQHRDLGEKQWFTVKIPRREANHSTWQHIGLPHYADVLDGRVAFAWRAMDAFYEEDERIVGHAADAHHRTDIRSTSRHLVVREGDQIIADFRRPLALIPHGVDRGLDIDEVLGK